MIKKILERLEEEKEAYSDTTYYVYGLEAAKKIVQEVAKEYGNGWIPVSKRLPNIGERVLLWVYGQVHIGKRIDAKLFEEYDIFSLENKTNESTKRIEAWMPLPIAPYQKGE